MPSSNSIEYRDIPNFPGYRVGSDGSVWCCWSKYHCVRRITSEWRLMKQALHSKGYRCINLVPPEGGSYKTFRVHRLVLAAFVGQCPDGMECRHLNGIKTDNRLENLAWGTYQENRQDARDHGGFSNRPRNVRITYNGETRSMKQWADHLKIPYKVLHARLKVLKMTFEEAISRPYLGVSSNGQHWTTLKKRKASGLLESTGH